MTEKEKYYYDRLLVRSAEFYTYPNLTMIQQGEAEVNARQDVYDKFGGGNELMLALEVAELELDELYIERKREKIKFLEALICPAQILPTAGGS